MQKMGACNTLTTEICCLVSKQFEAGLDQGTFKEEVEKGVYNRIGAEADLAAKFGKLESEQKLHESRMMAEIKRKQAENELNLEEDRTKLKMMQVDMDVKVAATRVQTYNQIEDNVTREPNTVIFTAGTTLDVNLNGLTTVALSQSHATSQNLD